MKSSKPHFKSKKPNHKFKDPEQRTSSKPSKKVDHSNGFSTIGSVGIVLNRAANSMEERSRVTKDFYFNQEAHFIESAIRKRTEVDKQDEQVKQVQTIE